MNLLLRIFGPILLLLGTPVAIAYDPATAINNFSSEYVECSVYYTIGAEGARRAGNSEAAERSDQASKLAFLIASTFTDPETVDARMKLYTRDQASVIKNDYANLSLLTLKYGDRCKSALESPRATLLFWLGKH